MVSGTQGSGATDPTHFQQQASNDLFNLGDSHSTTLAAAPTGSWTSAVEMDLHGQTSAATQSSGWTQHVDNNVVVIDTHSTTSSGHTTPACSAVTAPTAAAPSATDSAHAHIDTVHW